MAKRYRIDTVNIRGVMGDKWLLKLERSAFGWHYYGTETEDQVGYEVTVNSDATRATGHETHKYVDWLEFRRLRPFSGNPLFVISELLSRLWSMLRRIVLGIGVPLALILFAIILLDKFACNAESFGEDGLKYIGYVLLGYLIVFVVPTLIFAGLGFLWRKVFRIDERLQEDLRLNGYDDDLSDLD